MYNVENINESNVFVVKKDNSVKRVSYFKNAEEPTYVPKGTFVLIPFMWVDITDAMLKSAKEKGARKIFHGELFPSANLDVDRADVMPCQLRRATKEEVAQCIEYVKEHDKAEEEYYLKQDEENKRKRAEREAEEECKARELEEFRGSLKGKWMMFVSKVMRKLAVELLFLAGKCNKKQIANNERLGYFYEGRGYLMDDAFKKIHGMTIDEFAESGHRMGCDKRFFDENGVCLDSMSPLLIALGYNH